jgi:uncharacterized protein with HEPN domain
VKKSDLRIPDYLSHIVEAIETIERYTAGATEETFSSDSYMQHAVLYNLQIVGEAARSIARDHSEFATAHAHIPWEDMYLMRNRISHGYFTVDTGIVWRTVALDLPALKAQIAQLREQTP